MNRSGARFTSALAVTLVSMTGCASQAVDRSGSQTLVLKLGTSDGLLQTSPRAYAQETFVHELERLSAGKLKVQLVTDVGDAAPDAETQVVNQLVAGDLDLGYPATRAYAAAGITGLAPFEAPLVLLNHQAVDEAISSTAAASALAALKSTGLVGLAFADGGLRLPVSKRNALVSLERWRGNRFRVYNSPVQAAAVRALGGKPVNATHNWPEMMAAGTLDGVELGLEMPAGVAPEAPDLHAALNVALWPKVYTFVANQRRFDALSTQQQGWIRAAAQRAQAASIAGPWDDTEVVAAQCRQGMTFQAATPTQLAQLRHAVEPVVQSLRDTTGNATLMQAVDAAAARHPDPETPATPAHCPTPSAAATAASNDPPSALPAGVYRTEIPVSAVEAAGLSNAPGWSGTWTLEVMDGAYALYCKPLETPGRDCGTTVSDAALEGGRLVGAGHDITFVSDPRAAARLTGCQPPSATTGGDCPRALDAYSSVWRLDGDQLRFGREGEASTSHLDIRPWAKIG